jgi:uncharacterized protein (TIGR02145 family)
LEFNATYYYKVSVKRDIGEGALSLAISAKVIYGGVTDARDGKKYKFEVIGSQMWMAENLNFGTESGSWCNRDYEDNCAKYGRLYDWATAMGEDAFFNSNVWGGSDVNHKGVCPAGWHLPSHTELNTLLSYVGYPEGKKLKSASGWFSYNGTSGNGTDDYRFSALPGGARNTDGSFDFAGGSGQWWTATEDKDGSWAYGMYIFNYSVDLIYDITSVKSKGLSVRCVKD